MSDFKLVMQTIDTIQTTSISRELMIKDLQETYTIMSEHKIKVKYLVFVNILNNCLKSKKKEEKKTEYIDIGS